MQAAELLCAFLLFAASGAVSAKECGGDAHCAEDADMTTLLQSKSQLATNVDEDEGQDAEGLGSDQDAGEGEGEGEDEARRRRRRRRRRRQTPCEDVVQALEPCVAAGDHCTWTGEKCEKGCSRFPQGTAPTAAQREATSTSCPEYCIYLPGVDTTKRGDSNGFFNGEIRLPQCVAHARLDIGGTSSGENNGGYAISRPQYKVTDRYSLSTQKWEACGEPMEKCSLHTSQSVCDGAPPPCTWDAASSKCKDLWDGCWRGAQETTLQVSWKAKGELGYNPDITTSGVDIVIDCEYGGDVLVEWRKGSNYVSRVYYNLEDITDKKKEGEKFPFITFTPSPGKTILRLEAERKDADKKGSLRFRVELPQVMAAFERCMNFKAEHGQCLEEFGKSEPQFVSSPEQTRLCLNAPDPAALDPPIDGCAEWRSCLGEEGKEAAMKLTTAISSGGRPKLMEASQKQTTPWTDRNLATPGYCTPGSHTTCVDPRVFDVEAFDCNCFEYMKSLTPAEIYDDFCKSPEVCCDWKDNVAECPVSLWEDMEVLLLEKNQKVNTSMTQRSQADKDAEADGKMMSLDDSLSGKRCAE